MWIKNVTLKNIRSFQSAKMELSKSLNIIVGENNSGKSTILYAIQSIQGPRILNISDIRLGTNIQGASILFDIYGVDTTNYLQHQEPVTINVTLSTDTLVAASKKGTTTRGNFPNTEPQNFIYPYFSKRKVVTYEETINASNTTRVNGNFQYLYSKIDRISNSEMQPAHDEYVDACQKILGFVITAVASGGGKKGAFIIRNLEYITLDKMGEGVANVVGLLVDLCVAENKLFLIEEPENDIHPKALKSLLELILKKSENNQFIITTHSHIVTTFLGSQKISKVFHVTTKLENKLFTSNIREIGNSVEERKMILEQLGYVPFDLGMCDAWLFLEESSAERIIRDYLIPWFTPKLLGRIRTYSAHSKDEVKKRFAEFNYLFSFLNLEPIYKHKAWIIIDAGDDENTILEELKNKYSKSDWDTNHFLQFSEHDFEKYYPKVFTDRVEETLSIVNKAERKKKKQELLESVIQWIDEDTKRAKESFSKSAKDVVDLLKNIESQHSN